LKIIDYEYRDLLTPLIDYITEVTQNEYPGLLITVVVPEFVPDSLFGQLLHNRTADLLQLRLKNLENVVIIDVPFHIHEKNR
jgi:hypothetical protein